MGTCCILEMLNGTSSVDIKLLIDRIIPDIGSIFQFLQTVVMNLVFIMTCVTALWYSNGTCTHHLGCRCMLKKKQNFIRSKTKIYGS